ncbi:homoserine O-acetyltransferase family protein [Persicobacter psychrovividus]|uniref:Homoserine O-acetyltransferase n=1 Tax=Persicobacter psychrovividus TaxID=387638 RepID=A0ABM7VAJ7_9BACT|nr:homoserine O-acetyltransferase [Persicobacter psychrovividus]
MTAQQHIFKYTKPFLTESGATLNSFELAYTTLGTLNATQDNVVWVCHAFSGNDNVLDWWPGLFGEGKLYDPARDFIVCANMLGSCYGSTGPLSTNTETGQPYFHDFPVLTNRDIIGAFDLLRADLGLKKIQQLIGCSLGGQQALEWTISRPEVIQNLICIGASAKHSPWGIAFNQTQRMAIEQDPSWQERQPEAGLSGLKTARAVAMLSYRNYQTYLATQQDPDDDKLENFRACSYQEYQGEKLVKRFNAFSYWYLSKAMDSQNIGRKRGTLEAVLSAINIPCLYIGLSSDILFPIEEQQFLAKHTPQAHYSEIDSLYGHDGFLIESVQLTEAITKYYESISVLKTK